MAKDKGAKNSPKILRILKSAEETLLEGLSEVAGFEDAGDFKKSLLESLHRSDGFHQAVKQLHKEVKSAPSKGRWANSEIPRKIRPSGRMQASRQEPSVGQRDRRRGYRQKGGKRVGQKRP